MRRVSAGMMYSGILPRLLEQTDEAAVDGVGILSFAVRAALMLKMIPIIEPINGLNARSQRYSR